MTPARVPPLLLSRELPMLQWLEREGYDVSYATNVDVDDDPNLLLSHKAFLSVGHDEYWSWQMRDNVERARDAGVNLAFFSGNTSYWQVRYENSVVNNVPGRTMVGYKTSWAQDPITPDYLKTNNFRFAPVNRPETAMIGVMYVTNAAPPLTIEDASHWAFTGTGLKNGDRLLNANGTPFLGYRGRCRRSGISGKPSPPRALAGQPGQRQLLRHDDLPRGQRRNRVFDRQHQLVDRGAAGSADHSQRAGADDDRRIHRRTSRPSLTPGAVHRA